MKDCNCNKEQTTTYIGEVAVDNLESLPDYILAERDVVEPKTGDTKIVMVRVPSQKLFGNGTLDNVTTVEPNNTIEVPENQVLAGRIQNNGNYNVVELTTATSQPDFIITGNLADQLLIQSTGFIYIPNGHQYIVGAQYYSGEDGLPTTNDASGYKLFKPISSTKLVITLGQ